MKNNEGRLSNIKCFFFNVAVGLVHVISFKGFKNPRQIRARKKAVNGPIIKIYLILHLFDRICKEMFRLRHDEGHGGLCVSLVGLGLADLGLNVIESLGL